MYYKAKLLSRVKSHLRKGGLIAYPTESCFGIGCDPFNYKAINRVIELKRRKKNKGLIVISGKLKYLSKMIKPLTIEDSKYVTRFWPGPYSFILDMLPSVPKNLIGNHYKVAVRVTQHKSVIQLCDYLSMPLVSTSANKSRYRSIRTYKDCIRQFGSKLLVLPGRIGMHKKPSTIIDIKTKAVLRK